MAYEQLKNTTTYRAVVDVVGDLTDLIQKELLLVQAELSANISIKLRGAFWMLLAGSLGAAAFLILLLAIAFGIASFGIAMHWACLIVAGGTAIVALGAFLKGREDARIGLTPQRAVHQIQQDLIFSKEQLS